MQMKCTSLQIIWWWKIKEEYEDEIKAEEEVFGGERGVKRQTDLQNRVTQHNIVIASKYYHKISMSRLAVLLDLSEDKVRFSIVYYTLLTKVFELS